MTGNVSLLSQNGTKTMQQIYPFAKCSLILLVILATGSGCSGSSRPIDTQAVSTLASKLKIGMSEQQVLSIMGEPNKRSKSRYGVVLSYMRTQTILSNPENDGLITVRLKDDKVVAIMCLGNGVSKVIQ